MHSSNIPNPDPTQAPTALPRPISRFLAPFVYIVPHLKQLYYCALGNQPIPRLTI
jgi:hypothetical protein